MHTRPCETRKLEDSLRSSRGPVSAEMHSSQSVCVCECVCSWGGGRDGGQISAPLSAPKPSERAHSLLCHLARAETHWCLALLSSRPPNSAACASEIEPTCGEAGGALIKPGSVWRPACIAPPKGTTPQGRRSRNFEPLKTQRAHGGSLKITREKKGDLVTTKFFEQTQVRIQSFQVRPSV